MAITDSIANRTGRRRRGFVLTAVVAAGVAGHEAGPASAQMGPGGNGVSYSFDLGYGPTGATVSLRGTMMSAAGNLVTRECLQPSAAPVQLCRVSVNGRPSAPFMVPAFSPPGTGPLPGWPPAWGGGPGGPFSPMSPPMMGGMPGPAAPDWRSPAPGFQAPGFQAPGFQVSGSGHWGPFAGRGSFTYWRAPW